MAPSAPTAPIEGIQVQGGLKCNHPDCGALFSDIQASELHADVAHSGVVQASSCAIQELQIAAGKTELLLVYDESDDNGHSIEKKISSAPAAPQFVLASSLIDTLLLALSRAGESRPPTSPTEAAFIVSPLGGAPGLHSDRTSSSAGGHATSPPPSQTIATPPSSPQTSATSPPSSQTIATPPSSPQTSATSPPSSQTSATSPPSSQTSATCPQCSQTIATLPSSSQTSLPSSQTGDASFTAPPSSVSASPADLHQLSPADGTSLDEVKLKRILHLAQEINSQCRACWFRNEVNRPHYTFGCAHNVCKGAEWKAYKSRLSFPPNYVCYFCFAPFCAPFNHRRPQRGATATALYCDYPDALKDLSYMIYKDESAKSAVFERLGQPAPTTVALYKNFICTRTDSGLLGLYELLFAYVEWRESGRAGI
ncbi:hypothetical protein BKA93DRAFT_831284 [Sparassis latifolia]